MGQTDLLVLAGGLGTRLRAAVSDVPKPLAPVAGRPFLSYQLASWVGQGVTSLTFLLQHQAGLIEAFLQGQDAASRLHGCPVRTLTEPQPLGTGGAIAFAVRELQLTESFLVANADTWLGSAIGRVAAARAPAMAAIEVGNTGRYGSVIVAGDKVLAFTEKQSGACAGWINAGVYHLQASLFTDWRGQPFSLESELLPMLSSAGRLDVALLQTQFIDIGVPEDYLRFCRWIESGRAGAP